MVSVSPQRTSSETNASRRLVTPPYVMSALLTVLRSALGRVSVVDMTLPHGMSAGLDREATFAYCSDLPEMERRFLGRFRQSGGHREMHLPTPGRAASSLWTELPDSLDRSRKTVVLFGSFEQAEAALDAIEPGMSLVVRTSADRRAAIGPTMASSLREHRAIACNAPDIGQTFLWLVPAAEFSQVCDALDLKPGRRRRSREMSARARPARRSVVPDAALALAVPPEAPWHAALAAGALIHDGGYRSENDGDYSWLWTGPANHFRVLLTGVLPTSGRLHVSVIKTEDVRNLAGLRVLVNGRHVPHRFDPWSELSGKVVVDLQPPVGDMTVLSLVCPHMVPDADGRRLLGLCLDRIEMLP
jgi:hypothetical protein